MLRVFDSTFAITYALEIVAVVVAMLGVGATLLTLVIERRRELSMLRLVGAARRQVRRMVVIEAALIGAASQAIGLIVGLLLSVLLVYVINVQSFGWTIQFHVPMLFLAQVSVAVVVATALAGVYPARTCGAARGDAGRVMRERRSVPRSSRSSSAPGQPASSRDRGFSRAQCIGAAVRDCARAATRRPRRRSRCLRARAVAVARGVAPAIASRFRAIMPAIPTTRSNGGTTPAICGTASGRRFGYQVTFFRVGVDAAPVNPSRWAVRDLFMTHLAVSDPDGESLSFRGAAQSRRPRAGGRGDGSLSRVE